MRRNNSNKQIQIAFRLIQAGRDEIFGGWGLRICAIGLVCPRSKYPRRFYPGRSLLEVSRLKAGWYVDTLFVHLITNSRLFWKGTF